MPRVVHVKSEAEFDAALKEKKTFGAATGVVVDFTASWCGPCKMIGPIFDAMSDQYPAVTFLKVDVDEVQEVAEKCKVKAMPTFHSYFNAAKEGELVGADKGKLKALIDTVSEKVLSATSSLGTGHKLGGVAAEGTGASGSAPGGEVAGGAVVDEAEARRARMAAAAEARLKAMQAPPV